MEGTRDRNRKGRREGHETELKRRKEGKERGKKREDIR